MLFLYHADTAVCAAKVRVTLAEKQLPWDGKLLDIIRGDQFDPDYLKLNPNAVVPTLIHDGRIITESTIINEYLDECFPDRPMRPADAYGRARMRLWTKREDSIHDAINTMTTAIVFRPDLLLKTAEEREARIEKIPDPARRGKFHELMENGFDSKTVGEALYRFARLFRDMEAALAGNNWLTGADFTLADSGLISFFYRLEMLALADLWTAHFPRVADWHERVKARPSFDDAIYRYIPQRAFDRFHELGAPIAPILCGKFDTALLD